MNRNIITILSVLLFAFCTGQSVNNKEKNGKGQEKTFENAIYEVDASDKEMTAAMHTARKNLAQFETAIQSENPDFNNFAIKKAFRSDEGPEYIWISPVLFHKEKNRYVGIINSPPAHTKEVKHDDIVEIEKNEISDWMYFDHEILQGGYTIRVLRNRMSPEDRKKFDDESGYKFE
ncbi:MAG: DUF2314 domain-containing protein [Chryseobacterium sp.]|jgi:uncharacterized protein YegJ (DUF2314 family)|uniref:DUF2314 domain-containing protein n=1 Tax=Chryseobacterium sp. TaxID=1871047 RepID=UPI0028394BD7|nr:DUF2314 domain-containing protein [Chryseobacterium sp.]MDR2238444.1 DUF2314 domain-containing protein [Chryseobacterium sp.]